MSRIRYIKPEFFTDEDVAQLTALERILYIGLWTEADRRGRLVDKPVTLKVKLLPYDDCDVDAMLGRLAERGFIVRYEVQGARYIEIPKFGKHQRPHPKEVDLGYPDPPAEVPQKAPSREITRPEIKGRPCIPSSPVGSEVNGDGDGEGTHEPPLRERLDAVWLEVRGSAYRWNSTDENALRGLITEPDAEVLRRWRIALGTTFPRCRGVPDLAQNWNAYAAPQAIAPPRAGARATNADKDWDNAQVRVTEKGDLAL